MFHFSFPLIHSVWSPELFWSINVCWDLGTDVGVSTCRPMILLVSSYILSQKRTFVWFQRLLYMALSANTIQKPWCSLYHSAKYDTDSFHQSISWWALILFRFHNEFIQLGYDYLFFVCAENGDDVLIDVDSKDRLEILNHVIKVLGKPE